MDEDTKQLYLKFQETMDNTMEDYYLTHHKLIRLFKAYDENSNLYKTISKISTEIYPGDVRIFLNIYHELTNDSDIETYLLRSMENAAKLTNKVGNRSVLELQLKGYEGLNEEIRVLKEITHSLMGIIEESMKRPDCHVQPNYLENSDNKTLH